MSGFVKIDCNILYSSIWAETPETKTVWITMLALANANGIVPATAPGISIAAVVSLEDTRKALAIFESPDPDSKSLENKGKRIERINGGYKILNYESYRAFNYSMNDAAIQKREYRAKHKSDNVQTTSGRSASASVSASESVSVKKKEKDNIDYFDLFWKAYPRKVKKVDAKKAWDKIKPDGELIDKIIKALSWQILQDQWTKDGGQFIPHPSTWLNGKRWDDEKSNFKVNNRKIDCRTVSTDFSSDEELMNKKLAEMGIEVNKEDVR